MVVGADGALSRVAQSAGWPRQPTVPLVQAIVRVPADMSVNTVRVWFVPDDTPYFYWLIPESSERAVLGLIGEDGQETRRCLERFMEKRGFTPLGIRARESRCMTAGLLSSAAWERGECFWWAMPRGR